MSEPGDTQPPSDEAAETTGKPPGNHVERVRVSRPETSPEGTSTDDFMSFGEVQQAVPKASQEQPVTPAEDGHCGWQEVRWKSEVRFAPTDVYVELDAMLDMQEHAAEDTSVELGGVLIGTRGVKPDGTPYVVIRDSLRARHYRATRGSFTFTHETWADLNQQRAALPAGAEIVGWYHTHPGWSVFLSDMDIFICDHFFSHLDDVALVIDPTSGDTGLFVRRDATSARAPRRLERYYLHAHRRREADLVSWANYFSGAEVMSNPAVFPGRQSTPIIMTAPAGNDSSINRYLPSMIIGLLGGQLLLVALLVGMLFRQPVESTVDGGARERELAAREAIVDRLLTQISTQSPEQIQESSRQLVMNNESLQAANLGLMSEVERLRDGLAKAQVLGSKANDELKIAREKLATAEAQIKQADGEATGETRRFFGFEWTGLALGALLGGLIAGGAIGGAWWQRERAIE